VKKPVDNNKPKRPLSAYFAWMTAVREGVRQEFNLGKRDFTKVVKICADRWKKVSEEEKAPFVKKAKSQFETYKTKMAAYKKTSSYQKFKKQSNEHKLKKLAKRPKDPNAPKKPLSGYFRFMQEYRLKNPTLGLTECTKTAAKVWSELDVDGKKKYQDAAEVERKKYATVREEYMKSENYASFQEKLQTFNEKKKRVAKLLKKGTKKSAKLKKKAKGKRKRKL